MEMGKEQIGIHEQGFQQQGLYSLPMCTAQLRPVSVAVYPVACAVTSPLLQALKGQRG